MWFILAQLWDLSLVKVELPMLQLLLGWRLDTDTQISSNNCEVNPFVNWGGPGSCAKW